MLVIRCDYLYVANSMLRSFGIALVAEVLPMVLTFIRFQKKFISRVLGLDDIVEY